ncbi:MAG TPA: hypothetical protein VGX70_11655 [Gemmataceae bacterium]|nr:hypothetical protein [Gemmataceae bacterium]
MVFAILTLIEPLAFLLPLGSVVGSLGLLRFACGAIDFGFSRLVVCVRATQGPIEPLLFGWIINQYSVEELDGQIPSSHSHIVSHGFSSCNFQPMIEQPLAIIPQFNQVDTRLWELKIKDPDAQLGRLQWIRKVDDNLSKRVSYA